ncbi:hypothetical protein CC1G_09507 [Coprinopsis cinerea okayama7|uniref:CHAT domain-containing protein n=1 Tax=Coprinopsis cinerea (strain Okayama-7 / 130 / ATCC MYA-4618 / FGSC 9003) TaxID=240176 RepID=A8P0S8_COPC7|nr:hypothetical protein CC1G_09507 [Coprinopsis cinerea okayama7\|eukprot:XP_001837956.2 hypothetical protein CC1G_09507 [Coprinopsis cinerea okayama7\
MDNNPLNNHEDITMHEHAEESIQEKDVQDGTLVLVNELLESVTTGMRQDILETAITVLREAIREADGDNDRKAKAELALIKALITRFAYHGWVDDLDEGTRLLADNAGIESIFILELQMMGPEGDHCPEIVTLSLNLLHEYRQSVDKSSLDTAIFVATEAIASHDGNGNQRAQLSLRAGNALMLKYLACGGEDDLSSARALFHDAKEAFGTGDPMLHVALVHLRHVGFVNFLECGPEQRVIGLQEMAQYHQAAQAEDQEGQDAYVLGSQLMQGDKLGIDESILQFRRSLSLRPPQHPRRHDTLAHYALALGNRFGCAGRIKDLEQSVTLHREALTLRPQGHPDRASSLNNLANALSTRFGIKGDFQDLDQCIAFHGEALDLCPQGHPDRASSLNNLASALSTRFGIKGDFQDLDQCIAFHKEALALRPRGHPDRASSLNNLANALSTRFDNKGDFQDLDQCIAFHQEALSLFPHGHPDRASSLNNLANALSTRFGTKGDFQDLDQCIAFHGEALDLRPQGHPHRSGSLSNLATALSTRFGTKGDFQDLDQCIALHKEALALRPQGHPDRASSLNNLANALSTRFGTKGDFQDLDQCIAFHKEALALRPQGHPDRASSLNNLAGALSTRFSNKGDFQDLDQCIAFHKEALALRPQGHPDRASSLNNLATALSTRFGTKGDLQDLDQCIAFHKEALSLFPQGHPHRSGSLNNLATALSTRFGTKGDFQDLDQCIALHKEALALRPQGHPDRASSLNNLAAALFKRFLSDRNSEALKACIVHGREYLAILSHPHTSPEDQHDSTRTMWNHPDGLQAVIHLVQFLKEQYKVCSDDNTLNEIFDLLKSGVQWYGASPLVRLSHARLWASSCREFHRAHTALEAYGHGISSLPVLASLDLTLEQRQNVLVHAKDLSKDAVQCALEQNELETALGFLSTARSVFWSQALQFRGSFDRLDALHPDLASELRSVTRQLQIATEQHPQTGPILSASTPPLRPYLLSQQREEIIAKIRAMDGFHDFLLPPSPKVLKTAARKGPIVFLNASNFGCHALILKEDGTLHRLALFADIRLLAFLVTAIRQLARGLEIGIRARSEIDGCFEGRDLRLKAVRKKENPDWTVDDDFRVVLEVLWVMIGQPVVDALELKKTRIPPRIWWCPTGLFTFLPIHAAGIYAPSPSSESDCLSDYVVSSYCSAPQDLIAPPPEPNPDFKMLVAIEPERPEPGASSLPSTKQELEKIELHIPETDRLITRVGKRTTTGKSVLEDINAASIVHFGCHGMQDPSNPVYSCLLLSEGRLTMSSLIRNCQTSMAALAYLSACETAMGDDKRPDESLTLAATMQFAGFRSVVATMWSIHDNDAPIVADAFYRHLFRHGTAAPPDITDAAYGLHLAVKELREKGTSFHRWVPFVHHGI